MSNNFYFNLFKFLKKNQYKTLKNKEFLFLNIKNYYLSIKKYKNLYLYNAASSINLVYSNIYFLNLIKNKKTDK
jgi:hypothetical protein